MSSQVTSFRGDLECCTVLLCVCNISYLFGVVAIQAVDHLGMAVDMVVLAKSGEWLSHKMLVK